MRILMLTNSYVDRTRGGVELHVHNLAKELVAAGHEVTVGRTSPGQSLLPVEGPELWVIDPDAAATEGRSRSRRSTGGGRFLSNFLARVRIGRRIGRVLADADLEQRFDVVHHHDFITSSVIARRLAQTGLRQVWTNHLGEFLILRRIPVAGRWITRWLTAHFDAATGPSPELAEQAAVRCPIRYVPNGVDVETFRPADPEERRQLRRGLGIAEHETVCIVPRRWAPSKGVLYAARAMSSHAWPAGVSMLFVGAGESDFPEYAAEIRTSLARARSHVSVVDSVDALGMAEHLRASDICLIPSLLEATSLSALESMASGLPIVATDVGGLPELVSDATGLLVPPRADDELAVAVATLAARTDTERRDMGVRARAFAVDSYAWSSIARRISAMYEDSSA
ncbi:glycosyltransferase family 4 protein [Curtobacterium sp. MCBA15_009]|uniref:glycosyltransferase family 4 protein n=1 Tax=Curtobacterium sp. MCBA15_009 TaxID=1898737 RepID=UPI0009F6B4CF|nr:glycosyltransferase family 4 protein [Curtobacterium sp. MCBA15_009]